VLYKVVCREEKESEGGEKRRREGVRWKFVQNDI
jgi:hypothetical protein